MRLTPFLIVFAFPAWAEICPPVPDHGPRMDELMQAVREAGTEREARLLTNELWELWATAPDDRAQELLDTGLERRGVYDFEGAIKAFDALVAYCPDYAEGYNQRAFIAFMREDFAAALTDLDRTLELSPDHIAALAGKALTLMGLKRDAEAQLVLREALAMNPWLPERGLLQDPPGTDL